MLIALFIIIIMITIKYQPVYKVSLNGEELGYIKSKKTMENYINNEILISEEPCAIFTELEKEPIYEFRLSNNKKTNEEEIVQKLKQNKITMYKIYAIIINNEEKSYVKTWDEAESIIEEMKIQYENTMDLNISVLEKYTKNLEDVGIVELAEAKTKIDSSLRVIKDEKEKIQLATCNGIYLEVKPVVGNITSRYGAIESIRNHTHAGLDIAAPNGTKIKSVASGIIEFAGWSGGYGNFIIINHGNGVQTCYGHCSKLYVTKDEKVEAGKVIANVGSTGNSTGHHLHFEIRVNGAKVNPQKYIYN